MTEVILTKPGEANFSLFENFPKEIYPADSIRFKLPESINEEFLVSCYILSIDGKPKARAALYNNPHLSYQSKKTFSVGNYEAIDDITVSSKLLQYIFSDAKKKGAEFIIGPMNGSTWDNYRFSIHNDHPNFFLEPYHHLYYNNHFSNSGFEIIAKYITNIDRDIKFDHPEVLERTEELKKMGITFRNVNLSEYESELEKLFEFNSLAFKTNFLYTPISKETFMKKYSETKKVINPEFVILAEDEKKDLVGYFFCIDDLFGRERSLIVKTIARHPDKKWQGLGHVIGNMIYRRAFEKKYTNIIHAFVFEGGTSTGISKNFSGGNYKNYALYGKEI
jgi:hypothetical protein